MVLFELDQVHADTVEELVFFLLLGEFFKYVFLHLSLKIIL